MKRASLTKPAKVMSFTVIIPARMASSRLPNKPLADIAGVPMVIRCAQQALLSSASKVYIATDSDAVMQAAQTYSIPALLTDEAHPTGTDRLAQAAGLLGLAPDHIIVNVQGDEPLIDPALIDAAAHLLAEHPQADIATLAYPITDSAALFNPNAVKVVCALNGQALYFSRSPMPWARDALAAGEQVLAPGLPALQHIGLYAYRHKFLQEFTTLAQGPLEKFEALEQLRALENGAKIMVHRVSQAPAPGVDTEEDLKRVRAAYANRL